MKKDLNKVFKYCEETGSIVWLERPRECFSTDQVFSRYVKTLFNKEAGHLDNKGYIRINFNGKRYQAHRLAWFLSKGVWPNNEIDHINGIKTDNRLINLREVSTKENSRNKPKSKRNISGVVGVSLHNKTGKWRSEIRVDGVLHYLGLFKNKQEAIKARKDAEKLYGFHENHGRELINGN